MSADLKWRSDVMMAKVGFESEFCPPGVLSEFAFYWYVLLDDGRELGDRENDLKNFEAVSGVNLLGLTDLPLEWTREGFNPLKISGISGKPPE